MTEGIQVTSMLPTISAAVGPALSYLLSPNEGGPSFRATAWQSAVGAGLAFTHEVVKAVFERRTAKRAEQAQRVVQDWQHRLARFTMEDVRAAGTEAIDEVFEAAVLDDESQKVPIYGVMLERHLARLCERQTLRLAIAATRSLTFEELRHLVRIATTSSVQDLHPELRASFAARAEAAGLVSPPTSTLGSIYTPIGALVETAVRLSGVMAS